MTAINDLEKRADFFAKLLERRNPDDPNEVYRLQADSGERGRRKRLYASCAGVAAAVYLMMATRLCSASVTRVCGMLHGLEALELLWLFFSLYGYLRMGEYVSSYWYRVGVHRIVPLTFFGTVLFALNTAAYLASLIQGKDTAAHCLLLVGSAAVCCAANGVIFSVEMKALYRKDYLDEKEEK